jgi:hypothetical protein
VCVCVCGTSTVHTADVVVVGEELRRNWVSWKMSVCLVMLSYAQLFEDLGGSGGCLNLDVCERSLGQIPIMIVLPPTEDPVVCPL